MGTGDRPYVDLNYIKIRVSTYLYDNFFRDEEGRYIITKDVYVVYEDSRVFFKSNSSTEEYYILVHDFDTIKETLSQIKRDDTITKLLENEQ